MDEEENEEEANDRWNFSRRVHHKLTLENASGLH